MRVRRLLRRAVAGREPRARALARDVLRLWDGLWTFLAHEGLDPTNNRAERALRSPVIWRKTSFGSASGAGLRAVERLLTVGETCRQQRRNVFAYLTAALETAALETAALEAPRAGRPAPVAPRRSPRAATPTSTLNAYPGATSSAVSWT
jgi:hypothetical protein